MSFELAPGTLLNNRYQIKKVVAFSADGGVYLARDLKVTDKNWIVKELIPSPELDEESLTARRALFTEAVESTMQFDQPGLPRILDQFTESRREYVVMEYIEGVTLQVLCDMSVNPLPEKQILTWALQICDALIYLHNRPKPFIFQALSPAHVILTPDEKIKLINYGLDRFFRAEPPPRVFADDPNDVLKELVDFGETVCFLLTKEQPGPYGLPQAANVTSDTARVVNRTLQGEAQKAYNNFEDVRKDLELALNPPAAPKKESAPATRPMKKVTMPGGESVAPPWVNAISRVAVAFLSQRMSFLGAELAAVLIALFAAYWITHPGLNYHKSGPTAYLALGQHDFVAMQLDATHKLVDRQTAPATIGDVAVSGNWLYISDANNQRIFRYNTQNDQMPEKFAAIGVDRNPTRMVVDEKRQYLYVVHEPTHNVSRVNLKRDPPQMDAVMAVGNIPHEIAVSPKGDILYVANAKDMAVSFMDPDTNKNLGNVTIPGTPWGMAVSAEGLNQLWVCVQEPDSVVVIDTQTREVKHTITSLMDGKKPTSAVFSPDNSKVYVAMAGSNNVVVFDTTRFEATSAVSTRPSPQRLIYTPSGQQLWAVCASGVTMIDTNTESAVGHIEMEGCSGPAAMAP